MEQIDFSEYKLSKYDMNKLGFLFHKNKDNPEIILQAISFLGLENLINMKHNGIISKILQYFINQSDEETINHMFSQVDSFQDFGFMKRDYLNLCKYYYLTNKPKSINIFVNNILSKSTHNTEYIIQSKDINFIIENHFVFSCKVAKNSFRCITNLLLFHNH